MKTLATIAQLPTWDNDMTGIVISKKPLSWFIYFSRASLSTLHKIFDLQ